MKSFWISNVSKRLISVSDIGILLQPYQSINLLDSRHYSLTEDQIQTSLTTGALSRVKDKVVVRKVPPGIAKMRGGSRLQVEENSEYPSQVRSIIEHKEFNYEDLHITDDEYAAQNAELSEEDDVGRFRKENK